ncbi:MAG: DUF2399 domain-containing protein [Lachnospiraceae bacterium]|nr:DUF2399 domain-containing protein [Lachnospiraceae bacterium]
MGEKKQLEECIRYFRERKVYDRLFEKMAGKYRSLGHFGGTVRLSGLSREDCLHLGGFFQKDFQGQKSVAISAAAMEKALAGSRFADLSWEEILRGYFGEEMTGRKERKQQENAEREGFFTDIMGTAPRSPGSRWLEQVLTEKGEGYLLLMKHYREQPETLRISLLLLLRAIPGLPVLAAGGDLFSHELLAVFAARTTGDPHFFDTGKLGEQLLVCFLRSSLWGALVRGSGAFLPSRFPGGGGEESGNYEGGGDFKAEERAALFYKAGLLKDELSNHVLVYGISAMEKDGRLHKGIRGYLEQREPLHLTLMTLGKLAQVSPRSGKRIYMVENPAVFAVLAKAWPDAAVICGNGQIRLATLVLLDLFGADMEFWYAGDYDPEGLLIAQRLKERYGERLRFWKYRREFYEKYRSDVQISDKSLKKLDRVYQKELQEIRQAMEQYGKAAYQEAMLGEYLATGYIKI